MIKNIVMKNCATYTDTGSKLGDCKKINFIYGPNGSGKSTISNYLMSPESSCYDECSVEWSDSTHEEVVVYNREFRRQHFAEDIDGVFTLGKATIEDIHEIEELKKKLVEVQKILPIREETLRKKKEEIKLHQDLFRDDIWDSILKANEEEFQQAFTGYRSNKEKFKAEILKRFADAHEAIYTEEQLLEQAETLFSQNPEKCDYFLIPNQDIIRMIAKVEDSNIWSKVVVGNNDLPIGKLINQLTNSDWVNRGRMYIKNDGICPFCQRKTITEDFEAQLNAFFSGEYDQDISEIRRCIDTYEKATLEFISIVHNNLVLERSFQISKIDMKEFETAIKTLELQFSSSIKTMRSKEQEASRNLQMSSSTQLITDMLNILQQANIRIEQHNKMVDDAGTQKESLINNVWAFLLHKNDEKIKTYLKKLEGLQKAESGISGSVSQCLEDIRRIKDEIQDKNANVTSVQPTVDEINRSLQAYGFTNFKIAQSLKKINSYQIQRLDGTLASNTLSEGEETFISFLYFLQFAKGSADASRVSAQKILVLDDPICSLDSTVLYIVSSMVKTLAKDVRDGIGDVVQLFVLTHNVFFHKEASFIDGRTSEMTDVNFWTISKDNNVSSIHSYGMTNPIKTSYELLWQELRENTNASLVTTQNIMRRILENYFAILGCRKDDEIVNSFDTLEDKMICRSLISWINDGSHSIPDDLYIDSYTDSVDRYKEVFEKVFVNMGHGAHYSMMMGIVD